MLASRLGRYELGQTLGQGGSGSVYRATMLGPGGFRKPVALKVLHSGQGTIRREARIGGLLRHENLVDVYEIGEQEGQWYAALELCDGSLSEHLPLSPRAVVEVGLQVCAALDYAHHELGLVHLDLKPANLMVRGGVVKVGDLGVARAEGFAGDDKVRGTPAYMSPEQRFGLEVDARADVFSLGLTLLELASGARMRASNTMTLSDHSETLVLADAVPTAEGTINPGVAPAWLAPILNRCTAINKDERYADMRALAEALESLELQGPGLTEALGLTHQAGEVSGPSHGNVSEAADAFVGRQEELMRLAEQLDRPGLITLKGPAGIGKSRLVTRATRVWQDQHSEAQAWFCDLTEVHDLETLLAAVSQAMGLPLVGKVPQEQVKTLGHAIASRGPMVLVLDNFEQILELGGIVRQWAKRALDARLVVTSREPLGVSGERVVEVGPLSTEASVRLLVERARQRGALIKGDPDLHTLAERLDGLPLAVELAAGRLGVLSVADVLEHFSLSLLRQGGSGRHATLRAALDGSWAWLTEVEQQALAQLSVFAGGFTLEAAERVLDFGDRSVFSMVTALLERSMIVEREAGRFGLLVSVREYARERLADVTTVERRHEAYYAQFGTDRAIESLSRHGGSGRLLALTREIDNLVVAGERAADRGDGDVAERLLVAAWTILDLRGPYARALPLLGRLLADGRRTSPLHLTAARVHAALGHPDQARAHYERALEYSLSESHLARVLLLYAMFSSEHGDAEGGLARAERALVLYRRNGDRIGASRTLGHLGMALTSQGQFERSRACYDEALAGHRAVGNRRSEGVTLGNYGSLLWALGELEAAREQLVECLEIARALRSRRSIGIWLGNLGILERRLGRPEHAKAAYLEALAVNREIGGRRFEGVNLGNLGSLAMDEGRLEESRIYAEQALAIHLEVGNVRSAALVRGNLGVLALARGEIAAARSQFEEAAAQALSLKDPRRYPIWLTCLARCDAAEGDAERGHRHIAQAREAAEGLEEPALWLPIEAAHAEVWLAAGERAKAVEALGRAEAMARPGDRDGDREIQRVREALSVSDGGALATMVPP